MPFKRELMVMLLYFILPTFCLEFKSKLLPSQVRCFFEILDVNQKYKIDLYPISGSTYDFYILYQGNTSKSWQFEYSLHEVQASQFLNIHKLAPASGTYQICLKNNDIKQEMKYQISVESGLDLLELHLLPDNTDAQNVALQMEWVRKQTQNLRQTLKKVNSMRSQTQVLSSLVGNEIFLGVAVFSLAVVMVNGLFYGKIRKAVKQRKLI